MIADTENLIQSYIANLPNHPSQHCNLSAGGSCTRTWTINYTGPIGGNYTFDVFVNTTNTTLNYTTGNSTTDVNIYNITPSAGAAVGWLNVTIVQPNVTPKNVSGNDTFLVHAKVMCSGDGDCGLVNAFLRRNSTTNNPDIAVSTTLGSTPIYTQILSYNPIYYEGTSTAFTTFNAFGDNQNDHGNNKLFLHFTPNKNMTAYNVTLNFTSVTGSDLGHVYNVSICDSIYGATNSTNIDGSVTNCTLVNASYDPAFSAGLVTIVFPTPYNLTTNKKKTLFFQNITLVTDDGDATSDMVTIRTRQLPTPGQTVFADYRDSSGSSPSGQVRYADMFFYDNASTGNNPQNRTLNNGEVWDVFWDVTYNDLNSAYNLDVQFNSTTYSQIVANDTEDRVVQNVSVAAGNSCMCTAGQNWNIAASDNCVISSQSCDVKNVTITGAGSFTVTNSNITGTGCTYQPTGSGFYVATIPPVVWVNGC
jgi:hypothetical protein